MNGLKTTLLLVALTVTLVAVGARLGGPSGATIALMFAIVLNFGSYWFSHKIVLAMYRAREVTEAEAPDLVGAVRQAALAAGVPMPKVYIIPKETPNAFATGRNPKHAAVAATEGILRLLNRDELEGVMAHEIAHVAHRDTLISTVAASLAGAIGMLAYMAQWGAIFGGYGGRDERGGGGVIGLLVMAIVAPLAATMIQLAVSRSREYAADAAAAKYTHKPWALASALDKLHQLNQRYPMGAQQATAHLFIVNPLSGGGFSRLFSTHPPVAERIQRLQAMRAI